MQYLVLYGFVESVVGAIAFFVASTNLSDSQVCTRPHPHPVCFVFLPSSNESVQRIMYERPEGAIIAAFIHTRNKGFQLVKRCVCQGRIIQCTSQYVTKGVKLSTCCLHLQCETMDFTVNMFSAIAVGDHDLRLSTC